MVDTRRRGIAILGVASMLLSAGCTAKAPQGTAAGRGGSRVATAPAASSTQPSAQDGPDAEISFVPAGNAPINPASAMKVAASLGTLTSVKLTAAGGGPVVGRLSADKLSWATAVPLAYGTSYQLIASATNADGRRRTRTMTFRTLAPKHMTLPYINLNNGQVYGVGQPIPIHFDEPITDKRAVERALTVVTTPPVAGSWHWFDDQNVHWRPQRYWKAGTTVTVSANVFGLQVGPGRYGQQNVLATITIGRSKIAKADNNTHLIKVFFDGKLVRTIPTSMGRGGGITTKDGNFVSFWTDSGPHVVIEKRVSVRMTSASFGLPQNDPSGLGYDVTLPYGVKISDGGEYVHVNSGTVADQGYRNVSHGCLNVSFDNGKWFYGNFDLGDVVEVSGTPEKLGAQDGYGDWTLPWRDWLAGSALR